MRLAALLSLVEIGGLLFVVVAGAGAFAGLPEAMGAMIPRSAEATLGLAAGAYVAFFAYFGFEGMANMAEETHDVGRTLPRAILIAIVISAVLYALVSLVAVACVALIAVALLDERPEAARPR